MALTAQEEKLLRELLDKEAIRQSLAELAAAVDRVDTEAIAGYYTADAYDDHGLFAGTPEEFARRPGRSSPVNKASSHFLCQDTIDLQGDEAFVETYYYCILVWEIDGVPTEIGSAGRYHDRMVRTDDGWKIAFRRVVSDSATERPYVEWRDNPTFKQGKRFPDDVRYHREDWKAEATI